MLRAEYDRGHVSVCRGGAKLANTRHHLDAAGLTEAQWRTRWSSRRLFGTANGSRDELGGNLTVRVTHTGHVIIRLPGPLEHLANTSGGRYQLEHPVTFAHLGAEWAAQTASGAVSYTFRHEVDRGHGAGAWYLDASWMTAAPDGDSHSISDALRSDAAWLAAARSGPMVGVDFNADHLAAWCTDTSGNPVGRPLRIPLDLDGSATRRDAQVRHAITTLLGYATRHGAALHGTPGTPAAITVEDLDFDGEATRESFGHRRAFRHLISGFPTTIFRARLAAMAARAGVTVVAVDPAYSSKWGAQHWQGPTSPPPSTTRSSTTRSSTTRTHSRKTSRHEAAAVVLARRGLGHGARRRGGVTRPRPEDGGGRATTQVVDRGRGRTCSPGNGKAARHDRNRRPGNASECTPRNRYRGNGQHWPATDVTVPLRPVRSRTVHRGCRPLPCP